MNLTLDSVYGSRGTKSVPALYRYGMLVAALVLLANWAAGLARVRTYPGDHYSNGIIVTMLLLNHLASSFEWPRSIRIWVRLLALAWLLFGIFYVFFWHYLLFAK
jgi:hypothetical protein